MTKELTCGLTSSVRETVAAHVHRLLEHLQDNAKKVGVCQLSTRDFPFVGAELLGLSLNEQLHLVEEYSNFLGNGQISVEIPDLRRLIKTLASQAIHRLGRAVVMEHLLFLEHFMNRHSLELENHTSTNRLGHLRYHRKRQEEPSCLVYEYRDVGGLDIDVYELKLGHSWPVFFERAHPKS